MTEDHSWTLVCSFSARSFMNCRSRAEALARRLQSKLRSLGRFSSADDDDEDGCGDTATASASRYETLQDDMARLMEVYQDDPGSDGAEEPASPTTEPLINPCDNLPLVARYEPGAFETAIDDEQQTTAPRNLPPENAFHSKNSEQISTTQECEMPPIVSKSVFHESCDEAETDSRTDESQLEQHGNALDEGRIDRTEAALEQLNLDEVRKLRDGNSEAKCVTCDSRVANNRDDTNIGFYMGDSAVVLDVLENNNKNIKMLNTVVEKCHLDNFTNNAKNSTDGLKASPEITNCKTENSDLDQISDIDSVSGGGEEEEEEEEPIEISRKWGELRQIDRFRVRKVVQETERTDIEELKTMFTENLPDEEESVELPELEEESIVLPELEEKSSVQLGLPPSPVQVLIDPPDADIEADIEKSSASEETTSPRPPRIRRCSSLKTGKTPPGTPGRKIVRFADVLGLDLEDVKHVFLDDIPVVPQSAYSDLDDSVLAASPPKETIECGPPVAHHDKNALLPLFAQPGIAHDFLDRVRSQYVCLESCTALQLDVRGVIRVLNVDFHKSVTVRYTFDEWLTFFDIEANYMHGSQDGYTDRFSFSIYGADRLQEGGRLCYCIRYCTLGQEYWDNNHGANYNIERVVTNSAGFPPSPEEVGWVHFL